MPKAVSGGTDVTTIRVSTSVRVAGKPVGEPLDVLEAPGPPPPGMARQSVTVGIQLRWASVVEPRENGTVVVMLKPLRVRKLVTRHPARRFCYLLDIPELVFEPRALAWNPVTIRVHAIRGAFHEPVEERHIWPHPRTVTMSRQYSP